MLVLAFQDIGHGLEAAMRMIGCADRCAGRPIDRTQMIDQQEGIEMAESRNRKWTPHGKAAAFQRAERVDDARDVSRPRGGLSLRGVGVHGRSLA